MSVTVNNSEECLFAFLDKVINYYDLRCTLRISGGWVRDKILKSRNTQDMDIAIDNMTGEEFACYVERYLFEVSGIKKKFYMIKMNPEKSKHLETATMKLFGIDIDFTNLRTEEYFDDSRICVQGFGTPFEDSHRRDLTINSLFYNLKNKRVEDWTKKGVEDILYCEIRTPLDPVKTFLDDPLRILRAIRFSCKLNYDFDPKLERAASLPEVKEALMKKVSRERIGIEIQKIISQSIDKIRPLEIINKWGIYEACFGQKSLDSQASSNFEMLLHCDFFRVPAGILTEEEYNLLILCIYLNQCEMDKIDQIIRKNLAYTKNISQNVSKIYEAYSMINDHFLCDKLNLGLLILQTGSLWKIALMLRYGYFWFNKIKYIEKHNFDDDDFLNMRPYFDGNQLMQMYNLKPGKHIGELLESQLKWMVENYELVREKIGKDKCLSYLDKLVKFKLEAENLSSR